MWFHCIAMEWDFLGLSIRGILASPPSSWNWFYTPWKLLSLWWHLSQNIHQFQINKPSHSLPRNFKNEDLICLNFGSKTYPVSHLVHQWEGVVFDLVQFFFLPSLRGVYLQCKLYINLQCVQLYFILLLNMDMCIYGFTYMIDQK